MAHTRRSLLALAAGLTLIGPRRAFAAGGSGGEPVYASCARTAAGAFVVVLLDGAGRVLAERSLPDRGHDVAYDPVARICVAFARRPGTFAAVIDLDGRREPEVVPAAPGRRFYGHGVFSPDGAILYATENDEVTGDGLIGLYDARDGFRRVGEIPSGGIGPHELVWSADGRTLAVANGGYETSGDTGRALVDRSAIESTLVLIDPEAAAIRHVHRLDPDLSALSIRHLAVDRHGAVWFGCQHMGDPTDLPPLVGRLRADGRGDLIHLPDEMRTAPRNYIGSVAVSAGGETVAVSAPRGGLVMGFDVATGRFLGRADLADGCGIAPADGPGDALVATSGRGRLARLDARDLAAEPLARADLAFDNHLVRLG